MDIWASRWISSPDGCVPSSDRRFLAGRPRSFALLTECPYVTSGQSVGASWRSRTAAIVDLAQQMRQLFSSIDLGQKEVLLANEEGLGDDGDSEPAAQEVYPACRKAAKKLRLAP